MNLSVYFPMDKPHRPDRLLAGLQEEESELRARIERGTTRRGAVIEHVLPWHGNYKCRAVACTAHPLSAHQLYMLGAFAYNDNHRKRKKA